MLLPCHRRLEDRAALTTHLLIVVIFEHFFCMPIFEVLEAFEILDGALLTLISTFIPRSLSLQFSSQVEQRTVSLGASCTALMCAASIAFLRASIVPDEMQIYDAGTPPFRTPYINRIFKFENLYC